MKHKGFFIKWIQLGLVAVLISACTPRSTPATNPTGTPSTSEVVISSTPATSPTGTPSTSEVVSGPTQVVETSLMPTQVPVEMIKQGEVITRENAHKITQLDYKGRGLISGIAWSPDGAQLAVASGSGIYLVDAVTYEENHFSFISSGNVAFSPDGTTLASAEGSAVSIWDIAGEKVLRSLTGHSDVVYSVAFSPDGKRLVSGSQDGTVRLWDVASGNELDNQQGGGTFVYQVAFSPDGKKIASAAYERKIVVWEVSNGTELRPLSTYSGTILAFSPTGDTLATGADTEPIKLWNLRNGNETGSFSAPTDTISSLAISPDGKILASGSYDTSIVLWDISTQGVLRTLKGHDDGVTQLAFSPDGTRLASASWKMIKIWNAASGQVLGTLTGQNKIVSEEGLGSQDGYGSYVPTLAFSPDGEMLATGSESGPVKLYSTSSGELLGELKPPADRIVKVTFSRDSQLLAVAYDQYVPTEVLGVQIWDVATQTPLVELDGFEGGVYGVAFNRDSKVLVTSGGNPWGYPGFVKLWALPSGKPIMDMGFKEFCTYVGSCDLPLFGTTYDINFNPDGSLLTGINEDGSVHLYDIAQQKEVQVFLGVEGYGYQVAFSPDGKLLAASGDANNTDRTADLKLWEVESGKLLFDLKGHSQAVRSVAFSPNGQVLASSSWDGTVRLWDVASGDSLGVLKAPMASDIAFSPDGTLLATGGEVVRLWGVPAPVAPTLANSLGYGYANDAAWSPDGRTLAVGTSAGIALYDALEMEQAPTWHASSVGVINSLAFTPDGSQLVTAGWQGLSIWDLGASQEQVLQTDADAFGVAFSPDGSLLATGSYANDIQLWDVASGKATIRLKGGARGVLEVVAFSPDGKIVASASSNTTEGHSDGLVRLWEVNTGKLLLELGDRTNSLVGLAFSPDGKSLATGGPGNSVSIWDIASGKLLKRLEGHTGVVVSVAFSPDGTRLASLDNGEVSQVHVWDVSTGQSLVKLDSCRRMDYANQGNIHFSPDGSKLVNACEDSGFLVWNLATIQTQRLSQGSSFGVSSLAFSPDGKLLASGYSRTWDMEQPIDIILWNLETKTESSRLPGHLGQVNTLAFNPDGGQLASGGLDGTARLWDLATGASQMLLEGYPLIEGGMTMYGTSLKNYPVSSVAYSPDGAILAVGGGHWWLGPGWLDRYDTETGKLSGWRQPACSFPCQGRVTVTDIAFSPDGSILATSDEDGFVRLWDATNGKELFQLSDPPHIFLKVVFSPDGKTIATGQVWTDPSAGESVTEEDIRGGVHFWDVASGKMVDVLDVGKEPVRSLAFSPDGKLLAVGHDRGIDIWELGTGKLLYMIDSGDQPVIAFRPDGSLLAIGDLTGAIQLWKLPDD